MTHDENKFRQIQRAVRDKSRQAKKSFNESNSRKLVANQSRKAIDTISSSYEKSGAEILVRPAIDAAKTTFRESAKTVSRVDQITKFTERATLAKSKINTYLVLPSAAYMDDVGVSRTLGLIGSKTQISYGNVRQIIKPYFLSQDSEELLLETERELTKIVACIFQTSPQEASGWIGQFGKAVTAKIAGTVGTITLFGLVSTYGTAGTGTAISTLSGAASFNATMAALGLGGGMATGALVLSGFGIVVGLVAYKLIPSSNTRNFEDLTDEEKRIVETCALLATAASEKRERTPIELYSEEVLQFRQSLVQLQSYLEANANDICVNLDSKNRVKYRQHVLKDFKPAILDRYKAFSAQAPFSPEGVIGGVFYALHTRSVLDGSREEELVLDALRRSDPDLIDATENELANYLHRMSPEQQRGIANNVKGIYHELMYVEAYNETHTDTYAELQSSPYHEGSDIVIRSTDTGVIQAEYQFKATNSRSYVAEHQVRYADIEVLATSEVSDRMDNIGDSGFSNQKITKTVNDVSGDVATNTIEDRIFESGGYATFAQAGLEAIKMLNGKSDLTTASKSTLRTAASAAASTGITAFLFS